MCPTSSIEMCPTSSIEVPYTICELPFMHLLVRTYQYIVPVTVVVDTLSTFSSGWHCNIFDCTVLVTHSYC